MEIINKLHINLTIYSAPSFDFDFIGLLLTGFIVIILIFYFFLMTKKSVCDLPFGPVMLIEERHWKNITYEATWTYQFSEYQKIRIADTSHSILSKSSKWLLSTRTVGQINFSCRVTERIWWRCNDNIKQYSN